MTKCYKCNSKIVNHLWVVDGNVYCSPGCERDKPGQFEKLHKQLRRNYDKD